MTPARLSSLFLLAPNGPELMAELDRQWAEEVRIYSTAPSTSPARAVAGHNINSLALIELLRRGEPIASLPRRR